MNLLSTSINITSSSSRHLLLPPLHSTSFFRLDFSFRHFAEHLVLIVDTVCFLFGFRLIWRFSLMGSFCFPLFVFVFLFKCSSNVATENNNNVAIEGRNLSFWVSTAKQGKTKTLPILNDCSLCIPSGQFWMLLGPNGCGKSTLLKVKCNKKNKKKKKEKSKSNSFFFFFSMFWLTIAVH